MIKKKWIHVGFPAWTVELLIIELMDFYYGNFCFYEHAVKK